MDDELEDELVQEIFWAHVSLVSRAARAELLPMADWAAFYVRLYVLRPGTLAVFAALLAVVLLCQSSTEAWLRLLLRRRCELLGAGDAVKRLLLAPPPGSPAARSWEVQVSDNFRVVVAREAAGEKDEYRGTMRHADRRSLVTL